MRSSLAVVVFYSKVRKLKIARDMKETIRAIFVYIAANFRKRSNIRNLEYESNIRLILTAHMIYKSCSDLRFLVVILVV